MISTERAEAVQSLMKHHHAATPREAWERHEVRDFVLDSADELAKIRAEVAATGVPGALGLVVRVALPKGGAGKVQKTVLRERYRV